MGNSFFQKKLQALYRKRLYARPVQLSETKLKQATLVFAPHQDDEVLGCGGTVLKKSQAGADVRIVFMTDGSGSHSHLVDIDELKKMRVHEALAAGQLLGVAGEDMLFLGFPDGHLSQHKENAIREVSRLVTAHRPKVVYIPFRKEPPRDHFATNQIVLAALNAQGWVGTVYEYPVWYWYHWPWVSVWHENKRDTMSIFKQTLRTGFGLGLLKHFKDAVPIGDVKEEKWAALNQHKTQMTRMNSNKRWLTLHDVASGEFLTCFFQEHEVFHRYQLP